MLDMSLIRAHAHAACMNFDGAHLEKHWELVSSIVGHYVNIVFPVSKRERRDLFPEINVFPLTFFDKKRFLQVSSKDSPMSDFVCWLLVMVELQKNIITLLQ